MPLLLIILLMPQPTTEPAGISFVTTAFGVIKHHSPILQLPKILQPSPKKQKSPISGAPCFDRSVPIKTPGWIVQLIPITQAGFITNGKLWGKRKPEPIFVVYGR